MISNNKQLIADLHIFLAIIVALLIIGGLFIYSSSSVYALEHYGSSLFFVKKQIIGLGLGFIALFVARMLPLSFIKKVIPLCFFASVFLTALTLFPNMAHKIHGSSRWLRLFGVLFQPSELLRVAFLLYLAFFLEKKQHSHTSFTHTYIPLIIILGLPSIILLKQPDFGFTFTLLLTATILFFVAQFQVKRLLISIFCMLPVGVALILYYPYRLKRVVTFLNPWRDPKGSGFQIIQSLIAIGSGGFLGTGIAQSKQKFFYLPMQHTDFIFSIIAEETGFIGATFLILLYVSLLYFGLRIACNLKESFSIFFLLGFTILIGLQAIINIAVTTGLVPTKGIGLPFVSYGNSALVANLIMIGIIINMVYESRS